MKTRSPAKPVQLTQLVTSVRDKSPGGLSVSFADRNFSDSGYSAFRCKDSRYKTCPRLSIYKYFHSTVTSKNIRFLIHLKTNINFKSNNLICLLTCKTCGLQYVRETNRIGIK